MLVAGCAAVWNIPHILNEWNENRSKNDWRGYCFLTLLTAIIDFILLPFCALIIFSPMRWPHVGLLLKNDNELELRANVAATVKGSLTDVIGYFCGILLLICPFGRQETVWKGSSYYFRQEIGNNFSSRCGAMNKLSSKMISQGFASLLDWLLLLVLAPFLLLTPSVWRTTCAGLALWLDPANQPKRPNTDSRYWKEWQGWYATLWVFLFHQLLHCWVDLLHAPCLLLVVLSPLRQPALWRKVREESAKRERNDRFLFRDATDRLEAYGFGYSTELRRECATLSLLAVADLLLFPMLLPLWLTQYRYRGLRNKLWRAPAPRGETMVHQEVEKPTARELSGEQPSANFAGQSAVQDIDVDVEAAQSTSTLVAEHTAPVHADLPPDAHVEKGNGEDEGEGFALWGLSELFLIAAQAALLFTDLFFLLVPVPLLFLTQYRWAPVRRMLDQPNVFLQDTSTLYAVVLGQVSLILWDLVLAPLALVVLCSYRARPLRRMLSSTAALNHGGFDLHLAVIVNLLCILHDLLLLMPMVLLLPCCLCAYRTLYVAQLITQHMKLQADQARAEAALPAPHEDERQPRVG